MKVPFESPVVLLKDEKIEEVLRAMIVHFNLEFYKAVNLNDPGEAKADRERLHCRTRPIK